MKDFLKRVSHKVVVGIQGGWREFKFQGFWNELTKQLQGLSANLQLSWQQVQGWLGCRQLELLQLTQPAVLRRGGRNAVLVLMVLPLSLTGLVSGPTRADSQAWFQVLWLLAIVVAAAIGVAALWIVTRPIDGEDSPHARPRGLSVLCPLLLAATCSFSALAFAQTNPNLENGFKRYGSHDGSNLDTVSLMAGNWMLHAGLIEDVL